jgi:5-formyltetrahydrofolate cyclo-ligase
MNSTSFRESLRIAMRARRAALAAAERIAAASGIAEHLEHLPDFLVDQRVAGYWAVGGEVPLLAAVARLRARGQGYHLPVLGKQRQLRFAPLQPQSELQPNRFGIPEPVCAEADLLAPSRLDLVLVPLLGFDRMGHRLGMGGGWYDTSFAFLQGLPRPAQPLLVGIGYAFQEVEMLIPQQHDVTLDYVVTENELIDCNPEAAA